MTIKHPKMFPVFRILRWWWAHKSCAGMRRYENGKEIGFYCPVHEEGIGA